MPRKGGGAHHGDGGGKGGRATGTPARGGGRKGATEFPIGGAPTGEGPPGQPGGGESSESSWPELVPPLEMPQDPRVVLTGRLAALVQRVQELDGRQDDPRLGRAQERLQKVKEDLKAAGGRTRKRLFHGMADVEGGMERWEAKVEGIKEEARQAAMVFDKAVAFERKAHARLENAKRHLANEKVALAFRGFQVAAEASEGVDGFDRLVESVELLGNGLAQAGMREYESAWNHVAEFIA